MTTRIDLKFTVSFQGPEGGWSEPVDLNWLAALAVDDEDMTRLGEADFQRGLQILVAQQMNALLSMPDAVPRLADILLDRLKGIAA